MGFRLSLEPADNNDRGFAVFPSQREGYRLAGLFENKLRNMAWRISNFPWTGGAAVSESILRPDVLSEVIKESHFNGKRFSKNLPEFRDKLSFSSSSLFSLYFYGFSYSLKSFYGPFYTFKTLF